jgi:hypothetical protein
MSQNADSAATNLDQREDEYEWCWIACPHDPPCADAPASSEPRDE